MDLIIGDRPLRPAPAQRREPEVGGGRPRFRGRPLRPAAASPVRGAGALAALPHLPRGL